MNISKISIQSIGRLVLKKTALEAVCACQYYDLADCLDETSDQELINIINHNYNCELRGQYSDRRP